MSNANNPQLEKLMVEYQEIVLDNKLPRYLQQEAALLFFLLDKGKNVFYWDKDGSFFGLKAKGDVVVELYQLAELLGMEIQTALGDAEDIFTFYYAKSIYLSNDKVINLLTEMINTAFPEEPIQHPKDLEQHD